MIIGSCNAQKGNDRSYCIWNLSMSMVGTGHPDGSMSELVLLLSLGVQRYWMSFSEIMGVNEYSPVL